MQKSTTPSIRTLGDCLAEALAESPLVRAIKALRTWAKRPEVRAVMLGILEWANVDSRLQGHRERWEREGTPISVKEAEYALRCLASATFNKQVEPAQYLKHKLEETPNEAVIARYIEHAESESLYWDALVAYKESHGGDTSPMLSEWPLKGAKRPSGRGRPPRWKFRDEVLIPEAIQKLEGCGLPVTSKDGPSIAATVAGVFSLTESNVARIWESAPNRSDKRSRQRYSSQPCHMCGDLKVPMYRAGRNLFECNRCTPPI